MHSKVLDNVRVLLVEDEPGIARAISELLQSVGAAVLGPAASVSEALRVDQTSHFDVALLDYKLKGENVSAFVDHLLAKERKFLFYTSGAEAKIRYPDSLVIEKPGRLMEIVEAIHHLHLGPARTVHRSSSIRR